MSQQDNNSIQSLERDQTDDEEPINQLYIRAKQGIQNQEQELLKKSVQQGKTNEVQQYVKSLNTTQLKQIDNIVNQYKERIFSSDLEVDPESKLGRSKNFQQEKVAHLNMLKSEKDIQQNFDEFKDQQSETNNDQQSNKKAQIQQQNQHNQYRQKTVTTNISSSSQKKKGALWKALNRDKADFEQQFREFLNEKKQELNKPPEVKKKLFKYKPMILKNKDTQEFEKGVEESEIGSQYSELSDFAFGNAIDIMENFKKVFDFHDQYQDQGDQHKQRIKNFRDDEVFIVCCLFSQIKKRNEEKDGISKEHFEQGLLRNAHLLQVFNIDPNSVSRLIEKYETRKEGVLSLNEVISFMLNPVREPSQNSVSLKNEEIKLLRRKQKPPEEPSQCLLQEEQINLITDAFHAIDTFGDNVISLKQLLHSLRNDPRVVSLLPLPTVYIPEVRKTLPFERVIYELEQQMYLGSDKDKKAREKITWEQLLDSLQHYTRKDIPTKDKVIQAQRMTGNFSLGDVIEAPKQLLQYLKDRFELADKRATFFIRKFEYVDQMLHDTQFTKQYSQILVREKPFVNIDMQKQFGNTGNKGQQKQKADKIFEIPVETAEQTLQRLKIEADEFIDIDEIIDFFTRKGRPIPVARRLLQQEFEKRQQQLQSIMNVKDGSDLSSPDEKELKEKRRQRKQEKVFGKSLAEIERQKRDEQNRLKSEKLKGKSFGAIYKAEDEELLITVPQPYKFEEREKNRPKTIRQQKLEEMLEEKQAIEDAIVRIPGTFRANKVPKHVKNRQLLQQILDEQQRRRDLVKENSKKLTKQNENPFSFYYRDLQKLQQKSEQQPSVDFEMFKAREAPWFCSVDMLERIQQEKANRTQTYVKMRMHELQQMSKLPEGVKRMLERLKEKDQIMEERRARAGLEFTFQPERAKSVPNFKSLHKQFESLLIQKKRQQKRTKPVGFKFQETRKAPKRDYLDKENMLIQKSKVRNQEEQQKLKQKRKKMFTIVKYQPPSTKKFEAYAEMRKRQEEIKVLDEEERQQRELDKEYRREQFAKFVRGSGAIQDNTRILEEQRFEKIQNRRLNQKQWEQDFDAMMTNMMKRVIKRPLLVESTSMDIYKQDRNSRLKWLLGEDNEIIEEDQEEGKSMHEQPAEYETENGMEQQESFDPQQMNNQQHNSKQWQSQNSQQQSRELQQQQQQQQYNQDQRKFMQNQKNTSSQMSDEISANQDQSNKEKIIQQQQLMQSQSLKAQQQKENQQQQMQFFSQQAQQQKLQQQQQQQQQQLENLEDLHQSSQQSQSQKQQQQIDQDQEDQEQEDIDENDEQQLDVENIMELQQQSSNQKLSDEKIQKSKKSYQEQDFDQEQEQDQDQEEYYEEDPEQQQIQLEQMQKQQLQLQQAQAKASQSDQKKQLQLQQQLQLRQQQEQQEQMQQEEYNQDFDDQDQAQMGGEDEDEEFDQKELEEQLRQIIPDYDNLTEEEKQQAIIYLQQQGFGMVEEEDMMADKYNNQYAENEEMSDGDNDVRQHSF